MRADRGSEAARSGGVGRRAWGVRVRPGPPVQPGLELAALGRALDRPHDASPQDTGDRGAAIRTPQELAPNRVRSGTLVGGDAEQRVSTAAFALTASAPRQGPCTGSASSWHPRAVVHPIQRRFAAEDLVRLRRSDEQARSASSQRQGRIDPNPHQIDAVMFALGRLPEGGCILADEVGLGKTIEAGLVIAQLLAEGKRRLLIIVPKPLLGQWQHELFALFGIEARNGRRVRTRSTAPGVFLVGRELAGTETRLASRSRAASRSTSSSSTRRTRCSPASIGASTSRAATGTQSKAAPSRSACARRSATAPVLLLTATPIQNSLAELWGLVQYVDPTGTLLGDLPRSARCSARATTRRRRGPGARASPADVVACCQRTLRRQAQEFLERPFVSATPALRVRDERPTSVRSTTT